MEKQVEARLDSANWGFVPRVLLLVALLLPMFGLSATPTTQAASRIQPALLSMAARQPAAPVSVIVQKLTKDNSVEALVSSLGGTVTKDLHIINAFAATLPGRGIAELGRSSNVRWVSMDSPVTQSVVGNKTFITWADKIGTSTATTFNNSANMVDSAQGSNSTFGYGSSTRGAFAGFEAEIAPGSVITKVEVILYANVPLPLTSYDTPRITLSVSDTNGLVNGSTYTVDSHAFDPVVGSTANAGAVYVDVTSTRAWRWSDFDNNLEVQVDQTRFMSGRNIYYDAVGLRVTSGLGNDTSGGVAPTTQTANPIDTGGLATVYNGVVRATNVWNEAPRYLQGQGMTVAVIDSGIVKSKDLDKRLIKNVNFNDSYHSSSDRYGHGTFVGSIIAGDGTYSNGAYKGIAPKANLLNVRVSDDQGLATEAEVVDGLQWINDNRGRYNIKVVNMSLNSSTAQSYHTSPLDAAVEILWFNGITVVVSAGNNGTANLLPPANDPFVITVGATNDMGTGLLLDDTVANFSAYGTDETGGVKPDLVAPGTNIVAYLPNNDRVTMSQAHPANRINNYYFRMSGTSMAAPVVAGAAVLLLQDEPNLTPDQVKYRLKATAVKSMLQWPSYSASRAGAGYVDIQAAVHGTSTQNANTGLAASHLLWTGNTPLTWGSVNWNSVNWNSVNWNSVNWNSVNWNSVNWNSDYWGQ